MFRPFLIPQRARLGLKSKRTTATTLSLVVVFLVDFTFAQEEIAQGKTPVVSTPSAVAAQNTADVLDEDSSPLEPTPKTEETEEPEATAGEPEAPAMASNTPVEEEESHPSKATPVLSSPQAGEPQNQIQNASTKVPLPKFRTMILIEGIAKYGAITLADPVSVDQKEVDVDTDSAGLFGAQATLGLMPGGSTFMLAGRLRAGTYIRSAEAIATVGAEVLFGASFLRRADGKSFSYLLGGMGVEYLPTNNQDLLTLHAVGGSVVRGLHFGGGLHIGANDEFAVFMFGLHLGWGQLFY